MPATAAAVTDVFAALHQPHAPFVLPNCWDVASALLLQQAGFPAIGTTSLGVTAAAGLPDGAGEGRELTLTLAAALVPRLSVPLSVDIEGGYSDDPGEVATLVSRLADLGVAGVNLEDGRADGTLRPVQEHAAVVDAAASAGVFVNARTDTYWLEVGAAESRLEETVSRLRVYAEAGAGGVFVPGPVDLPAVRSITEAVDLPLNVLWRPGVGLDDLAAAGVARVSTGGALYRHALAAALDAAGVAREGGTAGPAVAYADLQALLTRQPH